MNTLSKNPKTKKTVTKKTTRSAPAKKATLRKIIAKADIGWGNTLFIRGEGDGLNWETGIPMQNVNGDEWVWMSQNKEGSVEVKFLINDQHWCQGDNIVLKKGKTNIYQPLF